MKRIAILISGRGSNMAALLRANLPAEVCAVVSNAPQAPGLEIARNHGVPTQVVDHTSFASRAQFDDALAHALESYGPDLVVLAGFMRILGEPFIDRFAGKLINVHPSLLPAFPGTHTHRRALEEGVRIHGCTVHFVTPKVDHGPIIVQAAVPVLSDDTEARLAARVLEQEHRILPQAVRWYVEGRLSVEGGRVIVRGEPFPFDGLVSPLLA